MTRELKPLTREERDEIQHSGRLAGWPITSADTARYEATVQALEAELAKERTDHAATLKRLQDHGCEWEPYTNIDPVPGDMDVWRPVGQGRDVLVVEISQCPDNTGRASISRAVAGRLAATLAHFARTGELPKPDSLKE